jgi:hypothetical protein
MPELCEVFGVRDGRALNDDLAGAFVRVQGGATVDLAARAGEAQPTHHGRSPFRGVLIPSAWSVVRPGTTESGRGQQRSVDLDRVQQV